MSPRIGTFERVLATSSWSNPPMASVSPLLMRTFEFNTRLLIVRRDDPRIREELGVAIFIQETQRRGHLREAENCKLTGNRIGDGAKLISAAQEVLWLELTARRVRENRRKFVQLRDAVGDLRTGCRRAAVAERLQDAGATD